MRELMIDAVASLQDALGVDDAQFALIARAVAAIAALMSLALTAWSVRRMRRPALARLQPALLGFAATVIASAFLLVAVGAARKSALRVPPRLLGGGLGLLQGRQTRLYWAGRDLVAQRTAFYMGLWGVAFVVTQGLAQLQNAALHAVGILTMMFAIGVAAGATANVVFRQARMQRRGPA